MASMAVSLVARGIYHETSPAMQTRAQINPTLMMSWWATIFSLLIIIVRLCGRYIRVERFFAEDKVMMISVIPLVIRMVLVHFVLILGTNNTTTTGLTEQEISNRELGSKLVLAARIFYAIL
jgi:magnesium-transporting ATPase (P-type)